MCSEPPVMLVKYCLLVETVLSVFSLSDLCHMRTDMISHVQCTVILIQLIFASFHVLSMLCSR